MFNKAYIRPFDISGLQNFDIIPNIPNSFTYVFYHIFKYKIHIWFVYMLILKFSNYFHIYNCN